MCQWSFRRVTTEAASTGETGGLALGLPTLISTTDGAATITVEIESPLWAEFDSVEYYVNNVPAPDDYDSNPSTPPFYRVTPDVVQTAGVDFAANTVDDFPSIPRAGHLEATTSLSLTGLTDDTWVVVLVRGTDGVSKPLFPVVPNDLDETTNPTLTDLTDGNLGELGVVDTAFTNPVFIDINGNAAYDAPLAAPGATRAVTIPAGSWANFAWTGDSSPPEEVAHCYNDRKIAVMYRLDAATQTFQRWIRDRDDLSNMGDVQRYDALLALNTNDQPATCNMPAATASGATRTLQWGVGWHNEGWSGAGGTAPGDAFACAVGNHAAAYRLVNGNWERYFPNRPDISNMGSLNRYDAFLILVTAPVNCTMPIAP